MSLLLEHADALPLLAALDDETLDRVLAEVAHLGARGRGRRKAR
jgi:hypothetical protein